MLRFIITYLLILLSFTLVHAKDIDTNEDALKKMIGRMLVVGFENEKIDKDTKIVKQIQKYDLGGVILFDHFYDDRNKTKNIRSSIQLTELTSKLKSFSKKPLLISIDQEGGKVARLKPALGFTEIPSAKTVATFSLSHARETYEAQANMLQQNGINCDFAPVVDLAVNPDNMVISGLERSYGGSSDIVTQYARIFMNSLKKENIISVLKHFPGHGSSVGDSHEGFVDISQTWNKKELEPYRNLINSKDADVIMTAHVFNSQLDKEYPATLSYNVNTKLLRDEMHYKGIIISDDLQMKAISDHFTLKETVTLAINSGVDILLFANQLAKQDIDILIDTIYYQVQSGAIALARIIESNHRIENLHIKNSIINMPIDFTDNRVQMTKDYIKQHYGLEPQNIIIEPKIIVLHWTAVMNFDDSFRRLKQEKLYSDRSDIASAGALNVSSHFLVARDGTIYQLMPDNWMARHVIGLNYSSIGVENIGGEGDKKEDLTEAQLQANIKLVQYLKAKYPEIEYLIGHLEYTQMESTPLWLEKDADYRTKKVDPGEKFMVQVRESVKDLELQKP